MTTGPGSQHRHTVSGKNTSYESAHTHSETAPQVTQAELDAVAAAVAALDARVKALEDAEPVPPEPPLPGPGGGPLNDPQPDVSGVPVPAGFAAGTMTLQQAIDAAPAGSLLNVAVNRTVNEQVIITKPLSIVFGVPGGPQLTITKPDPASAAALISLSDDVKLYRPRLRGIGVAVGAKPPIVAGDAGAIMLGGSWKGGVSRNEVVNADVSDVLIDGIELQATVGSPSVGNRISACLVARAGRCGVSGGGGEDFVGPLRSGDWQLARTRITNCNTAGHDGGESASACKWLFLSSALVEDCEFDTMPTSRGFWTDTMVTNLVFRRNRMHDIVSTGAFFESSHYVEAYDNVIYNCNRNIGWGWGGGITSATSDHLNIHHNTFYRTGSGVSVVSQQRQDTMIPTYGGTVDVNIHDNTIIEPDIYGAAWFQDWAGVLFAPASNNRGSLNKYWVPAGEAKFVWNNADYTTLAAYNGTPAEEGGTYMTTAQKDAALAAVGL